MDRDRREWDVIDYRMVDRRRKRLRIGDVRAIGRAFMPRGHEHTVMVFAFGAAPERVMDMRVLQSQLDAAHPVILSSLASSRAPRH
ncbi:MAG TPA: hypothetical protein VHV78_11555 [Gemmatimonadaceae bacterium]|nr:hypothetical protein [Gemmatimonadaceae bacterium]